MKVVTADYEKILSQIVALGKGKNEEMLLAYAQAPSWRGWLLQLYKVFAYDLEPVVEKTLVDEVLAWKLKGKHQGE